MTDPIADLLTRIRNAYSAHHDEVVIPFSSQKAKIVDVLVKHGYVESVETIAAEVGQNLKVTLKYVGKSPAITAIKRISTPGRRVYSRSKDVKSVLSGHGIRILSTNKGIMTNVEAQTLGVGGEIICKIW
jgi:small subunit ribosomal protein S8